jgi:nicotinamidase-related amidase
LRRSWRCCWSINDFLSDGGRAWPQLKEVIEENRVLDNMRTIHATVRKAGINVFFVPHRRWEPGDYESWRFHNPSQRLNMQRHLFARGEWGGEWHPDFVPQPGDVMIREHWAQSGFANTDLDAMLKQHGSTHCILVGLLANTCVESTGRFGMELGYHVTLVTDATAFGAGFPRWIGACLLAKITLMRASGSISIWPPVRLRPSRRAGTA